MADPNDTFGFPHTPYPVQMALMQQVYSTMQKGGVAILESPTGTGKTLSLLCPALAWMRRHEREVLAKVTAAADGPVDETIEDWAAEHRKNMAAAMVESLMRRRRDRRDFRRQRMQRSVAMTDRGTNREKARKTDHHWTPPTGDAEFSLEEPPALPRLDVPDELDEKAVAEEEAFEGKFQIVFCSRTHSQLAQVLQEIKRIPTDSVPKELSVVTLGGRKNLCVNDSVKARASSGATHLNDLCKKSTQHSKAVGGCTLKKQAHIIADACLTHLLDIEGMALRGRASVGGGCPYYGSRQAAKEADVLLVPYASLVNNETRRKLGIRTEGNVLIFDEAHNLLAAISDSNSVNFTVLQARTAVDDLAIYAGKYEARLTSTNSMRLRQVKQFCTLLHRHLANVEKPTAQTVGAFLVSIGADHFDLPVLSRFLEETELPRKVRGYVEAARVSIGGAKSSGPSSSVYGIAELLGSLLGSTGSDRILCQPKGPDNDVPVLKYLSLDAEARFRELFSSARAVLFAGGTLEPRTEFAPLYAGITAKADAADLVNHFSGRHVVPSAHIHSRYVTHGPGGHQLDFRSNSRGSPAQVSELKAILASSAPLVPGGAIFFFPSFDFLSAVAPPSGSRLGGRCVFVESRGAENGGDGIFKNFSAAVKRDGGAVLLAVNGAKLSEGIDFKDDLCRLVAVVGLPYPNSSDLGLLEKMRYLDRCRALGQPGLTGKEFYTARCMKGVNQCVGRSIRHINDWAAILLLDHRYAHPAINNSISLWLREKASASAYNDCLTLLRQFYAARSVSALPSPAKAGIRA